MSTIFRYLKSHTFGVLLAFLMICITVAGELTLPTLMSDIITTGIQQQGIEHSAPEALSTNAAQLITTGMTQEEKDLFEESYTLVKAGSDEGLQHQYPLLETQDLYVRNSISSETQKTLDRAFGTSVMTLMNLAQASSGSSSPSTEASDENAASQNIDLARIYELLPLLRQIPESEISSARSKIGEDQDLAVHQYGLAFAKAFTAETGVDIGAKQTGYITGVGLVMIAVTIVSAASTVMRALLLARIGSSIARDMRRDVFKKVTSFSNQEFDRYSTASLITRSTNDVTQIQQFIIMGIGMFFRAPLTGIFGIVLALRESVSMAWIIALAVILLLGLIVIVMTIAIPKFTLMQKLVDRINLVARENLNGISVIRAFHTESFEMDRYDQANHNLARNQLFINNVMAFMMPAMILIMNLTSMFIIWIGAGQIASSSLQIGSMMAFMQYAMQIIISFLFISMVFIMLPRALVSAKRVREILDSEPAVKDPDQALSFDPDRRGLVEFRNVSFHYADADEDAIQNISFTAEPGKTTALIGATGSGKSTLINLIPRLYDCTEGEILVGGRDVRSVTQHDLRERIGYVPQKGILHKGTIRSNITYGKHDATEAEIREAADTAQATEFISRLPDGFDSPIAAGGTNVSGGQKQRISIARALIKKPDIYIFDDSFSALDFKTDAALREALKAQTQDATVIIVAQRVGTILNADQILVMDEGRIIATGRHHELLETCPLYYEIASSQLAKEELV